MSLKYKITKSPAMLGEGVILSIERVPSGFSYGGNCTHYQMSFEDAQEIAAELVEAAS